MNSLGHSARDISLVRSVAIKMSGVENFNIRSEHKPVTGRKDVRGSRLSEQEIDDVEEAEHAIT